MPSDNATDIAAERENAMEDSLASQDIILTNTYGGSGGGTYTVMSGQFISSLIFYTAYKSNAYFLQTIQVTFNDNTIVVLGTNPGTTNNGVAATLNLANDSISRLYVYTMNNKNIFGGNNNGVGAIYAETVNGVKFQTSSQFGTPLSSPSASWQLVTPPSSNQPVENIVLIGLTGMDGAAIDSIGFYYKNDILMSQGMANVTYYQTLPGPGFPNGVLLAGTAAGTGSPADFAVATVTNNTSTAQQMSVSISESVSSTYTFTATAGLSIGYSVEVSGSVPLVAEAKVTESASFNFSVTIGVAKTFTKGFGYQADVAVGPGQSIVATATATKYQINGFYTATYAQIWAHAGASKRQVTGAIDGSTAYNVNVNYANAT